MVSPVFPQNSEAGRAYRQMMTAQINSASLDLGCHQISYSQRRELPSLGFRDRRIDSCEIWTAYSEYATRVSASLNVLREQVPWFYDSLSISPQNRQLLQSLDQKIAELRSQNASLPDANLRIAQGLYDWLVYEQGIMPVNNVEEQGLLASLENRRANCSEFFSLFKFVFERAGLSVTPVFVFESANGDSAEHIATLFQHAGQNYLMDPLYHSFDTRHRRWLPLSLREFWAWHFNNRATLLDISRRAELLRLFARAEQLDATNPHFPNNLGLKLEEMGEFQSAELAYQRSIRVDSHFVEAYVNVSALLLSQGRNREALIWLQRAFAQCLPDARLDYNTALAHFNLGNFTAAHVAVERAIRHLTAPDPSYESLRADIQAHRPHLGSISVSP